MEDKTLTQRIKELYVENKGKSKAGGPMITENIGKEARFSHVDRIT